jgi:hypothetical protein
VSATSSLVRDKKIYTFPFDEPVFYTADSTLGLQPLGAPPNGSLWAKSPDFSATDGAHARDVNKHGHGDRTSVVNCTTKPSGLIDELARLTGVNITLVGTIPKPMAAFPCVP